MGTAVGALFHVGVLTFYIYVWICQLGNLSHMSASTEPEIIRIRTYGLRYLTKWTFAIQTAYYSMCVAQHILNVISAYKISDKLKRYSDYLCTSIATPVALMISTIFWTVFIYDRQLIFPRILDKFIPLWVNHSIHTLNSVFAIMDIILVNHKFPTWPKAIRGLASYLIIYAICLFGTYFHSGVWLYPLLNKLNWPQRILLALGTLLIGIIMHGLMKYLNRIVWGIAINREVPKIPIRNKYK